MKWVYGIEIGLIILSFFIGACAEATGRSVDEKMAGAMYFIFGLVVIVIFFLTMFAEVMWQMAFRG